MRWRVSLGLPAGNLLRRKIIDRDRFGHRQRGSMQRRRLGVVDHVLASRRVDVPNLGGAHALVQWRGRHREREGAFEAR